MSNKWTQTRRLVGLCLLFVSQTVFVPCHRNELKPRLILLALNHLANCALSVAFTKQLSRTELHIKSIDDNYLCLLKPDHTKSQSAVNFINEPVYRRSAVSP